MAMAQISRPFQIALLAVVLLAGVWLFALQGHGSSSTNGATAEPAPAPSPAAQPKPAAPSSAYHGSAPGVAGLTGAVAKAKGAVATSQQNAKQLAEKSAQASSPSAVAVAPAAKPTGSAPARATSSPGTVTKAPAAATRTAAAPVVRSAPAKSTPVKRAQALAQTREKQVQAQLKAGDVVVVLFWDHKGADDVAVQHAVNAAVQGQAHVVLYQALAGEVASFGAITRGVQVFGTPTLLFVNEHAHAAVVTGLTDTMSIRQAITDARSS